MFIGLAVAIWNVSESVRSDSVTEMDWMPAFVYSPRGLSGDGRRMYGIRRAVSAGMIAVRQTSRAKETDASPSMAVWITATATADWTSYNSRRVSDWTKFVAATLRTVGTSTATGADISITKRTAATVVVSVFSSFRSVFMAACTETAMFLTVSAVAVFSLDSGTNVKSVPCGCIRRTPLGMNVMQT